MKLKTFICASLCGTLLLLLAICSVVYYVDPYFQYHTPQPALSYEMKTNSFSYYNAGIAKNFNYDTIITGSSMSRAFLPSYIDEQFSCKTVKLSMAEARGKDFSILLPLVMGNNKLERVIMGLDTFAFTVDKDYSSYEKPSHLYDSNIVNDGPYLTNIDGFVESLDVLRHTANGDATTSMDDYQNYTLTNTFSAEKVIDIYLSKSPVTRKAESNTTETVETILDNLNQNLIPFIESYPNVEFMFYFPPYSIVRWGILEDPHAEIVYSRTIIERLISYPNVSIYFYQGETDCITDLDHYMDTIHFDSIVANNIIDYMKDESNKLTAENYNKVLDEFETFIDSFDYDSLQK